MAALIRIGLTFDAFDEVERAEFLPLLLETVTEKERSSGERGESAVETSSRTGILVSSNAFTDAVQALWLMYRFGHDQRVLDAILRMTVHPESNVRFLAVREIGRLRNVAPETVWEVAERAARDDDLLVVSAG